MTDVLITQSPREGRRREPPPPPGRRTEAAEGAAEPEGVAVWAVNLPRVQPSR